MVFCLCCPFADHAIWPSHHFADCCPLSLFCFSDPIFNGLLGRTIRKHRMLYSWITWVILLSPFLSHWASHIQKHLMSLRLAFIWRRFIFMHFWCSRQLFAQDGDISYSAFFRCFNDNDCFLDDLFIWCLSARSYIDHQSDDLDSRFCQRVWCYLAALIGWRIEDAKPFDADSVKTFSRIYGKRKIGEEFLANIQAENNARYSGLVDDMGSLRSKDFSPENWRRSFFRFMNKPSNTILKQK